MLLPNCGSLYATPPRNRSTAGHRSPPPGDPGESTVADDRRWAPLIESLGAFSPDFLVDRDEPATQRRPALDVMFD